MSLLYAALAAVTLFSWVSRGPPLPDVPAPAALPVPVAAASRPAARPSPPRPRPPVSAPCSTDPWLADPGAGGDRHAGRALRGSPPGSIGAPARARAASAPGSGACRWRRPARRCGASGAPWSSPPTTTNLAAVAALDVGVGDLQQCADSVIRLHAEWLFAAGTARRQLPRGVGRGHALRALGARASGWSPHGLGFTWSSSARADAGHASYRRWLDAVFTYANTGSLARDGEPVAPAESPPRATSWCSRAARATPCSVLDLARAPDGRRALLLGQGYMPAQSFHVLRPGAAAAPGSSSSPGTCRSTPRSGRPFRGRRSTAFPGRAGSHGGAHPQPPPDGGVSRRAEPWYSSAPCGRRRPPCRPRPPGCLRRPPRRAQPRADPRSRRCATTPRSPSGPRCASSASSSATGSRCSCWRITRRPVVCLQTWFGVGSRHERPGKTGLAHLFEHLMFGETEEVGARRLRPAARGGGRRDQRRHLPRLDVLPHQPPEGRPPPGDEARGRPHRPPGPRAIRRCRARRRWSPTSAASASTTTSTAR